MAGEGMWVLEIAQWVALIGGLGVAALADLRIREIPNTCPAVIAAAGVARVAAGVTPVVSAVAGVVATVAVLAASAAVAGRAESGPAVGAGDVKLLAATSLYLGLVRGLAAIGLACAALLAVVVTRWAMGCARDAREALPFAPAIAVGVLAAALGG